MKKNLKEYRVIDYFDVWGNMRDGWEVNNQCVLAQTAFIDYDAQDFKRAIMAGMKKAGFFNKSARMASFHVDWNCSDGDYIELRLGNGYPICRLEAVKEEATE